MKALSLRSTVIVNLMLLAIIYSNNVMGQSEFEVPHFDILYTTDTLQTSSNNYIKKFLWFGKTEGYDQSNNNIKVTIEFGDGTDTTFTNQIELDSPLPYTYFSGRLKHKYKDKGEYVVNFVFIDELGKKVVVNNSEVIVIN